MNSKTVAVWRDALRLLSLRLVMEQLGLVLGVFVLFVAWLRLPDASALEVIGSGFFAVLIVAAAGFGESRLILSLSGRASSLARLLRGTLLLLIGAALWFGWSTWIAHLGEHDALRAGYLNSRGSHQLRYLFTYEHILLWLGWMWTAVTWIGAGLLSIFVFTLTASARPMRASLLALRSLSFWLVLLIGTTLASVLTGKLMGWTPLHGLRPELISLAFRLAVAAAFDTVVACWLLSILAVCVRRADAGYSTLEGGPDDSQPRTVEIP